MPQAEQESEDIPILLEKGTGCHRAGDLLQAAAWYQRIIAACSDHADALHLLGLVFYQSGQADQAVALIKQAAAVRPGDVEVLANLATAMIAAAQPVQALSVLRQAVSLAPNRAEVHHNLGVCLAAIGDGDGAEVAYRRALALAPAMAEALTNLGVILKGRGEMEEAMDCFARAVVASPPAVEAAGNLADCLGQLDRFGEARAWLEAAIAGDPLRSELHYNMGNIFKAQGCLDEAIACFDRALYLNPTDAKARWNRSLALLAVGRWTEAWPDYEQRLAKTDWPTVYPFRHLLPRWNGQPFAGRLLVHDEQGFGDAIQFVRFLPQVKAMGMTVVFETRKPLLTLMAEAAGCDELVERPADGPCRWGCQAHIGLMSLPGLLGVTVDTIPSAVPYLAADRQKTAYWRRRLAGPGFKVGLVWAGNPHHGHDRYRSLNLRDMRPLAANGIRLFGLQKGAAGQTAGADILEANLGDDLEDFSDTAAVVSVLDLVIAVDTATAHLAGALGRPVWVLIPARHADWRWLQGRSDSPWYPSMTLWRQPAAQDWRQVVALMTQTLGSQLGQANTVG